MKYLRDENVIFKREATEAFVKSFFAYNKTFDPLRTQSHKFCPVLKMPFNRV